MSICMTERHIESIIIDRGTYYYLQVNEMENPEKVPTGLADFKGKPPRVEVTREPNDDADVAATRAFLDQYTDKDGFHCPRCPFTTTNIKDATYHLAEEINKALDHLSRPAK